MPHAHDIQSVQLESETDIDFEGLADTKESES